MVRGARKIKVEVTDGRNTRSAEITVNVQGTTTTTDDDGGGDLDGGCQTGKRSSWLAMLAALALLLRRRA